MSAEWDELIQKAARQLDTSERERELRENEERKAAANLKATFDGVAEQYVAIATSFAREVLKHGLPGVEDYTFDRHKQPLFGSRFVKIPLVLGA